MVARLVVSLSGLPADAPEAAEVLERADGLAAELDARGVPLSQLFRPRGSIGPARRGTPVVDWLHARRAVGDVIVLHGYDHTDDPIGSWGTVPRLARRAEFATLPRHEAALRLTAARRVAAVAGLSTDLFVPPRWLASAATIDALREQGFAACADEGAVRVLSGPDAGRVHRARVLGFRASGERRPVAEDQRAAEAWRCRVLAGEVARTSRRGGLVRIAVRAKDLRRPARWAAVVAAVDVALALGAVPVTYRPADPARAA
jgi:predicted deacetylase